MVDTKQSEPVKTFPVEKYPYICKTCHTPLAIDGNCETCDDCPGCCQCPDCVDCNDYFDFKH